MREKKNNSKIAYRAGQLFNTRITDEFWSSFKGEIGRTQAEVLVYLHDHQKGKITDMVEELNVPKQHLSKIVIDFVEKGLIQSSPSDHDRRCNLLSLTEKGNAYMDGHFSESYQHFEDLLKSLESKDRDDFMDALETIERILSR